MTNNKLIYWLLALAIPKLGPRNLMHLYHHYGDIERLFSSDKDELLALGLNHEQIKSILSPAWHSIDADLTWLSANKNHHIVTITDPEYPAQLKEISDPPLVLYVEGNINALSFPQIAIVGARAATPTGYGNAKLFAHDLCHHNFQITSGLALGIDTASHEGALNAKGTTIAVIGSGLNNIYPRSNEKLAQQICMHQGAIISEFSINSPPRAQHFPRRNRIIAGLSVGVIVVEAAIKSGSLITARLAVEAGREVFALPGSIHNRLARGCHYLIKQGAKLVENPQDVLEELSWQRDFFSSEVGLDHASLAQKLTSSEITKENALPKPEQQILQLLSYDVTSMNSIIMQSGLTTSEVSSILLSLELQGLIQLAAGGYVRSVQNFD